MKYTTPQSLESLLDYGFPKKLIDAVVRMDGRVSIIADREDDGRFFVDVKSTTPFSMTLHDMAVLSDLNLQCGLTIDEFWWASGRKIGRDKDRSLFGSDALDRFAELSDMPLLDYMSLRMLIDAGAEAGLIVVWDTISAELKRELAYEWRFFVYPSSTQSREAVREVSLGGGGGLRWVALEDGRITLKSSDFSGKTVFIHGRVSKEGGPYTMDGDVPGVEGLPRRLGDIL